jgi:hypothetical protein
MTKKSRKARKERQKRRRKQKKRYSALRRRLKRTSPVPTQFVVEPKGEIRMSEVLEAFVEPFLEMAETEEAFHRLLTVASAAWNISLVPKGEQKTLVDKMVDSQSEASRRDKRELRSILYDLIERKRAMFPDIQRAIVDYHLEDTGDGFHLSVASTLLPSGQVPTSDSQ